MKFSLKSFGAVALISAGSAAYAGNVDPVPVEPAPAPVPQAPVTFDTDWTGAYIGGQLGYGDVGSDSGDLDGDGAIGGVHAGYLWDLGSYVLGGELDYDIADISLGDDDGELDSVTRAKFKAGYDGGSVLYYGVLGAAYAEASAGGADFSDTGYVVGAGIDYMLTDSWVLGGELLYHDFGDEFDDSGDGFDATTLQARLSYKF